MTTSALRGILRWRSLRLCSRAPAITSSPCGLTWTSLGKRTDVPQGILTAACGNPHPRPRAGAIVPRRMSTEDAPMPQAREIRRTRRGDVLENSVTGERAIVLLGTDDSRG